MSYTDIASDGGMDPRNRPGGTENRPAKLPFKCSDCGHTQLVSVAYGENGERYFGSGANWCDSCGDGKPELVDQDTDAARLERHRALHNIVLPPHPELTEKARRAGLTHLALANCQQQLQVAIRHLQAILNESRTATQSWQAEQEARQWLLSIGSEPR